MSQRLPRAFSALLCLLSSSCFRSGYEMLEQAPLAPEGTPLAASQGGSSGFDAGVLLSDPTFPDGGSLGAAGSPGATGPASDCHWAEPSLLDISEPRDTQLVGGPHLAADGLTLYFSMQVRGSSEDIYLSTRSSPDGSFGDPVAVAEVNSASAEGTPFLTADGSSLYFFSQRGGGQATARDLYVASRSTPGAAFGTPTVLPGVNSNQLDQSPYLSSDGLELWLGSHRGNTGFEDLFVARRARTTDDFDAAVAASELNSPGRDTSPALSDDGTRMYYASERNDGEGGFDLWLARRANPAQDFDDAEALRELNGRDDEFDATLSSDEREIVFVSDRSGSLRLWRSLLECP